ncbi:hypothetical protein RR48_01820 [Papilio machaon]|uniref:Uncharacterized protein n=1 Tax=Papilio machaon TaxID=76193 RepID=A0A0N1I847_PAPMA|nr:hypothetical protein RR48_01820 [Papilio machaon]
MGRVLVWDATCSDTLAPSHLHETNNRAGAACEAAEKAKANKYRGLGSEYEFVPFGVEPLVHSKGTRQRRRTSIWRRSDTSLSPLSHSYIYIICNKQTVQCQIK